MLALAGNSAVARDAERDQAVIGELRRCTVFAAHAAMTIARNCPLLGIVEQREPAHFLYGQCDAAGEVRVVFAAVRIKLAKILLKDFERLGDGREIRVGVGENCVAGNLAKFVGVARPLRTLATTSALSLLAISNGDNSGRAAWSRPLFDAPVPGQAPGRAIVDTVVAFLVGLEIV